MTSRIPVLCAAIAVLAIGALPATAQQTRLKYDKDGRVDMFKSNKGGHNVLWHNEGDGTFKDVTVDAGVYDTGFSMGSVMGDLTNDGNTDLVVAKGGRIEVDSNRVYKGLGNGKFKDVTAAAGIRNANFGASAAWFDVSSDFTLS